MISKSHTNFNGYFFADSHERIVHANESLRKMCGYAYAALEGSPMCRLFCDAQGESIDSYQDILQQHEVLDWATHVRHVQGKAIAVTVHICQVWDDQGLLCGFEGCIMIQSEIASTQRYGKSLHTMLDDNPAPMIRVSKDGVVLYANKASSMLLQTLGGKLGETVSRGWKNWILQVFNMSVVMEIDVACLGTDYDCRFVPQGDELLIYAIDVTDRVATDGALNGGSVQAACDALLQQAEEQKLTLKAEQQVRHMSEQALLDATLDKEATL